jgi:hypothetical protein
MLRTVLLLLALPTAALADTMLKCEMSGTWVEDKETFTFAADYTAGKTDRLSGTYSNAGVTANVGGAVTKGKWSIQVIYTSDKHKGQVRDLIGTGTRDAKTNTVSITGDYTSTKNGKADKKGTFKLAGKCK